MKLPLVSIIMATFNRAHLIEESLNSIKKQTMSDWECLIIDDGGTDETEKIIRKYQKTDPRFVFQKRTGNYKKGLPGCRNHGLDLSRGRYVVFFDDDDIVHPQLLELSFNEITRFGKDYCRYLRATFIGDFHYNFDCRKQYNTRELGLKDLNSIITGKIPFNSCQVLWRKECFSDKRFVEELMYAEEWELYSRILSEGKKGVTIEKVLFFGRKHKKSNTGEFRDNKPIRKKSQVKAALYVIDHLSSKNLFNKTLKHHFLRLGLKQNSREIISKSLAASNVGVVEKYKYTLGQRLYPILKPIFFLKSKILKK